MRLKAKGYHVTIIDQCPRLGGRAQQFKKDGYIYDAGPTVITAPFLFTELFELFNENINDYVKIVPVEPWYRFVYSDGSHFNYGGSINDTLKEIEKINPNDKKGYLQLVKQSEKIFDVGFSQLADKSFHNFTTMIAQIPALISLKCYKSVWQMVSSYLEDEKLKQAFSIQPLLVGGNPFSTTSIYSLIHFLERKWGVHFAIGGTGAVVDALEQLMIKQDINIKLNQKVIDLQINNNKVDCIVTNKEHFKCDVLVSNIDPKYLYKNLVPQKNQSIDNKIKTKYSNSSMGLFVIYFGTKKTYPDIVHHTIWLGKRYKALLNDIFNKRVLADDFSLYLHRPTATDPEMAPAGCNSFYVLSPVPNNLSNIDWQKEKNDYARKILKALEDSIMPNLSENLSHFFVKTPDDFETEYSSIDGSGFSITPTFTQSAWFRYHNKSKQPENLYLCGAGTHPGAGVPGVLCSAKVVDSLIPKVDIESKYKYEAAI